MTKEEYWNEKKNLLLKEARSYRAFELGIRFSEKRIEELEQQIKEMKCCLSTWYEYENERDTPQINIDELLTETQQLISEIKEK